ncbi:MAG: glycogen/starch/alpha-glucan phosphorylase [Candidatus Desulfaltia sp.]|nr:glycogen/starch/alpha-glucan phosphorylase [Candidatus Desulfaltia sp.]
MHTKNNKKLSGEISKIQDSIRYQLKYSVGKLWEDASQNDLLNAVSLAVRERMIDNMFETEKRYQKNDVKRLYYFSMEYLIGRSLGNNLYNLKMFDICKEALMDMGIYLEELLEVERDAALGNGGLGRLAACFLDSLATLDMPGFGYGINYEFGLFKQQISNGYQKEKPDQWFSKESPWLIDRPENSCIIPIYGKIEHAEDRNGDYNPMWMDWKLMIGVPHDMPIVGYGGSTVNYLRLFSARSSDEFDMQIFNEGDYLKAVKQKVSSETISKVLYPSDSKETGKELRLVQEYFLVACSIKDIIRRYLKNHDSFDSFSDKVAIQLNDTHPALTIAELMRTLIDEKSLSWGKAWDITQATIGYTNHTLMPEALEKWPVSLMEHVLPRHLQIIYEINKRFLSDVSVRFPNDSKRLSNMSIIEENNSNQVRMAYLSIIGSHSVNGVSALHSELLKTSLAPDFYELWPERFNNKTNGVSPRRWLNNSNRLLSELFKKTIGEDWITNLYKLKELENYAEDSSFQEEFLAIKKKNKDILVTLIFETCRVKIDTDSLFDIQAKRIHEYKRQLLNVMCIIYQYLRLIEDKKIPSVPKTYIFAGKAAPEYFMAKLIIKLINSVGKVINNDKRANNYMKVVFIPDYRVSLAEKIIPGADLSEQISTAGMEASGTGNMKFAMNGALTIGTLDGANIEIMEEVGSENIYIFGLKVEDISQIRNYYNPLELYNKNPMVKRVMDAINSDMFCKSKPDLFKPIYEKILYKGDKYFYLADFQSYINTQEKVSRDYINRSIWAKKAILNVARTGKFSSDRTISEYARDIWKII